MSNVSTRRRPLDRWLLTRKAGFPANPAIPYPDRFRSVSLYLLNEVHPNVEKSAWAHSRFPGHALTPTGVMAIRCKQFHLPDL